MSEAASPSPCVDAAVLPNAANAQIDEAKITGYLLSPDHPDGRDKAAFFARFGFSRANWATLADALRRHAVAHPVAKTVQSNYGTRYVIEGELDAPDGRRPLVRTARIVEAGQDKPRLVTAYPL